MCAASGEKGKFAMVKSYELWTRLKIDYERHCYQQAEMLVRKRLQRLLTSGRCRIEPD
jgi:hypothetical protein